MNETRQASAQTTSSQVSPRSSRQATSKAPAPVPQWLWGLVALSGGLTILGGAGGILIALILPSLMQASLGTIIGGVGWLALLIGMGLLGVGVRGWRGHTSPKLHHRWNWAIFLLLTLALAAIAALLPPRWHHTPYIAMLHLGLIMLPAFLVFSLITLAAGRLAAPTLREGILSTTGGMLAVLPAIPAEVLGLVASGVGVVAIATLVPGGAAEIDRLSSLFDRWMTTPPTQIEDVLSLMASPVVLAVMAITLAVFTPLIEEFGKTLVLGLMGIWARPSATRAFTWGVACGMGFALVEGVTNGASGLGDTLGWISGVGARALATMMHMLSSGLMGLGWYFFWRRRYWALPLAYLGAALFHGLWNLNIVAIIGGIGLGQTAPWAYAIAVVGVLMELALILLTPIALIGIPLLLRRRA